MQHGKVKVHRFAGAVDCGIAVNPDIIRAQMDGGIGFALSALRYGEIEIKAGHAVQRNFDAYRVLRIHEMPWVEVHIAKRVRRSTRELRASTRSRIAIRLSHLAGWIWPHARGAESRPASRSQRRT